MLELKFAIYYRAASLPSQASCAVLAEESQAFFKHSQHINSISNSAILRNNYISLLRHFGHLATFWFGTFAIVFSALGVLVVMKTLENEW